MTQAYLHCTCSTKQKLLFRRQPHCLSLAYRAAGSDDSRDANPTVSFSGLSTVSLGGAETDRGVTLTPIGLAVLHLHRRAGRSLRRVHLHIRAPIQPAMPEPHASLI